MYKRQKINGVDVTSQFTASTSTLATVTITGVSSPLTKLELTASAGAAQPRFTAIYIDDVMLVDPMTPENTASAAATPEARSGRTPRPRLSATRYQ